MELYQNTYTDASGNIVNGATVTVYTSTGAVATIYDYLGAPQSNPFLTGLNRSEGEIEFAAADGRYDIKVENGLEVDWLRAKTLFDVNDPFTSLTTINGNIVADSITTLKTYTGTAARQGAVLTDATRGGQFYWNTANLSAQVAGDAQSGIYVAPNSDATGASGAWVRRYSGAVYADWFGASPGATATANSTAIQAALNYMTSGGELVFGQIGTYQHSTGVSWIRTSTAATNPGITIRGQGRRTTTVQYTGTTGFGWTIKGTALNLTRAGLIEGITIRDIGLKGATRAAANTESGVYVQAFNHFNLDNALISDYGQDGIHLDRIYYNLAPDTGIDDRGAFVHLKDSEISLCGRYNIIAGGINSATDYSIDHLITENLHVTTSGNTGMKAYVNNWTDIQSLYYGDAIGVELYAQNTDIITQNVTMLGTRFEGGQSDCMLKIISCKNAVIVNPFFAGHSGPLPVTQVKIATSASYNVGNIEFINPIFQQATTAIDIVGSGGVVNVLVRDPTYSTITTEIANAASKPVQQIKGAAYERVTGGGAPIQLTGAAGIAISAKLSTDANTAWYFDNSTKRHYMGNGTAAADVYFNRSALAPANGTLFSGPIAVSGTAVGVLAGSGSPEGVVTAPVGWLYLRTDGGTSTTLYVKETGTGNTGWVAK